MTYKSIIAVQYGSPNVLQVIENVLHEPSAKEVRIKVLAASVSRPDVAHRTGATLYSGTPMGKNKLPFTPGYAVIGQVEAIGEGVSEVAIGDRVGVLTIVGGYTEYLYWKSDRLIPVPAFVDPVQAVTLILNYVVAYQSLHRVAKVQTGETALIIGASGGIGTALMQLGQLAGLKMYGLASRSKHSFLTECGAIPIDYHTLDFVDFVRDAEPDGIDVVMDGMSQPATIRGGLSLLRRGGRMVSYGDPGSLSNLLRMLGTFAAVNLAPNGKSYKLYGTSTYFLGNRRTFLEDWATLFEMLAKGLIKPVIAKTFPITEAGSANQLLESGRVTGNVVLVSQELQ